ncbi:MAG TPA: SsrA-binding protein SmpB [candidate division Zixibacteria bacterium]|nr:SsrA-binding protein SmpB [candidate division Zixibacteria bacterium]
MTVKIKNRKAYSDFEIEEKFEAGVELLGPEVKSIRAGRVSLKESYARVIKGEVWVIGMHITPYENLGYVELDPQRRRKLLLNKHEIRRITRKVEQAGYTLVPLELYFSEKNLVKILLGLGKGRTKYDKKQHLIEKDKQREVERALKDRGR